MSKTTYSRKITIENFFRDCNSNIKKEAIASSLELRSPGSSDHRHCVSANLCKYTEPVGLAPTTPLLLFPFCRKIWDTKVADPSTR